MTEGNPSRIPSSAIAAVFEWSRWTDTGIGLFRHVFRKKATYFNGYGKANQGTTE